MMQPALSTSANSGFPAGARQADDMTPEAWAGLIGGLMEFLGEEVREPEHAADAQPHGAGVAFVTPEGKALFLKRSANQDHPNEYAFPGGGVEAGENAVECARREAMEEIGHPSDGQLHPIDRRTTGGVDFMTFAHPVDGEFEPKLNGEHTSHVWAPLDDPPRPLHPGVEATLKGGEPGADSMPIQGGKKSPFDPGTDPAVGLDDEYHRDAKGEFASEGEVSGSSTSARERSDIGGRTAGGEHGGSSWSENELRDYADEKPEGIEAADAAKEAEHTATIKFNGDFDMAGLLKHLHHLGAIGASRAVDAIDADDKPVHFGWDGDGADKIVEAEIDGKDVLAGDEAIDGVEVDATHDGPWMSCMSKDRRRMYRNKNVPAQAEIDGKPVAVDPILVRHEKAEVVELEKLLAEFEKSSGREPNDEERKAIYLKAHKTQGTPAERDFVEQTYGPGFWDKWSAWCRGEEAKIEKMPATNPPDDADVKPIPHGHGDLEAEDIAIDSALRLWLALDRDSVRTVDPLDGKLRISKAHISKANVCPYAGHEIPNWESFGLDPEKIYYLYRDPDELRKAAETSNGVQVLRKHIPVSADDHQPWDTIGASGTDAEFNDPYLDNSLVIWTQDAIDAINSGEKKQISMGYHYRFDPTPGVVDGQKFDGIMRDLSVNHLAMVENGRAGDEVAVGDSADEVYWLLLEDMLLNFSE